jgi:hypothetical protein
VGIIVNLYLVNEKKYNKLKLKIYIYIQYLSYGSELCSLRIYLLCYETMYSQRHIRLDTLDFVSRLFQSN